MYDALNVLQTLVTKTATFGSTGYDTKTGTPRRGMVARFLISDYKSTATAGAVWTAKIQDSDDNTTFNDVAAIAPITCTTASQTKELNVPFTTRRRYIRAYMELTTSSGSPTVSYLVDLGNAYP